MSPWWLDLQQKQLVTTSPWAPITCLFRGGAIILSVTVHAFTGLSPNIVNRAPQFLQLSLGHLIHSVGV